MQFFLHTPVQVDIIVLPRENLLLLWCYFQLKNTITIRAEYFCYFCQELLFLAPVLGYIAIKVEHSSSTIFKSIEYSFDIF